jgi:hypothetical protein
MRVSSANRSARSATDLSQLDGEVGPGEARRGGIVFEVTQDATGLRLRLKGNITATGSLFELGSRACPAPGAQVPARTREGGPRSR